MDELDNISTQEMDAVDESIKASFQLQSARYAMHKVRLAHYQTMMRNGVMQPDLAKQYYLAAMQNYDDIMKGSASGCFSEAIEREMKEFDINEAFRD